MTCSKENSLFRFPESLKVIRGEAEKNIAYTSQLKVKTSAIICLTPVGATNFREFKVQDLIT